MRDYKDSSEIPGIITEWFVKRYPNRKRDIGSHAGDQRPRRGRRDESPQRDGGDGAAVDGKRWVAKKTLDLEVLDAVFHDCCAAGCDMILSAVAS